MPAVADDDTDDFYSKMDIYLLQEAAVRAEAEAALDSDRVTERYMEATMGPRTARVGVCRTQQEAPLASRHFWLLARLEARKSGQRFLVRRD